MYLMLSHALLNHLMSYGWFKMVRLAAQAVPRFSLNDGSFLLFLM